MHNSKTSLLSIAKQLVHDLKSLCGRGQSKIKSKTKKTPQSVKLISGIDNGYNQTARLPKIPDLGSPTSTAQSNSRLVVKETASKAKRAKHRHSVSTATAFTATTVFTRRTRQTVRSDITPPNSRPSTATTVAADPEFDSLYTYTHFLLQTWRKTRPADVPIEERWVNRGMAIVFYILLEMCVSNPIYKELAGGQEGTLEVGMMMGSLELASTIGKEKLVAGLCQASVKVSRMPAPGVYTCSQGGDAVRIDSLDPQGTASSLPANGAQQPSEAMNIPPVSIWAALVLALTDRTQTVKVLEAILHLAFPDMDVHQFLYRIGDPSQRITDDESDMLREKLRPVLFPNCNTLF